MKKEKELTRGQPITFRIPSDTPNHILKHLQSLKESERRNFSSKIAEFTLRGVNDEISIQKETITIPLPNRLNKAQRDWLKHEQSEALLGSIVYQLLSDPIKTVSLLTSLNSGATYTYEQNDEIAAAKLEWKPIPSENISGEDDTRDVRGIDIDDFTWESEQEIEQTKHKNEKEDLDDLLGDFLAQMNK
ncbi:hypothetical protein [Gottfriedia solisilvae]|uniref:Uncharacterized protein n=1 Tax=Gottfriedia solisilvae TaxID=1516104 RepID=A0A8J3AUU9_9BACI|nr:hypothetical protein [Gottfriedia solisilvae]GGI16976.1 hypothetical protein GCM10007380_35650 [Gottfriedia solisilvae]